MHCGFTLNRLLHVEQWLFGGVGLPRGLSVYYILFSFVCSLMDFEQIGCEIFISCSLLACQFIVLAASFTNASASSQFEENQGQDWAVGSQSLSVVLPGQQFGFILRKDMSDARAVAELLLLVLA